MAQGRTPRATRAAADLLPCAQRDEDSRGREHFEEQHRFRGAFQRDRDRIVHSRSFRRLEYKTQVFLNGTGDHYRTRLTHTIEVASVSRTVARELRLNEDLAECIALAHDLGHSPFGHAGENALNELMLSHGGFEHNVQSLRIVEELEVKYPEHNGLNLTWEVREGLKKGRLDDLDCEIALGFTPLQPSLEAQIVDISDEIAYTCADLDDSLESELVTLASLSEVPLWRRVEGAVLGQYPRLEPNRLRACAVRCLMDLLVEDAISATRELVAAARPAGADDVRRHPEPLAKFGPDMEYDLQLMRDFLHENFYHHEIVTGLNRRGAAILDALFEAFVRNPTLMGPHAVRRIKKDGVHRAACDFLAGMTDSYARIQFDALIGDLDPLSGLRFRARE
ncbi:MAG: deoxyguanosinetriphosphate triphosphohydrolase [Verrucomicrobiae bacterium]|nr:deoxyguanosinetriphosphate triphosphohydrolase [Verrucomicrobiae bacterium]